MDIEQYLQSISIDLTGEYNEDAYVIDISNSDEYGKIYSKLEKSDDLDLMYDNQVLTEQGSSIIYESQSQDYLLNLVSDFESDRYQLIISKIN